MTFVAVDCGHCGGAVLGGACTVCGAPVSHRAQARAAHVQRVRRWAKRAEGAAAFFLGMAGGLRAMVDHNGDLLCGVLEALEAPRRIRVQVVHMQRQLHKAGLEWS